MIIESLNVKLCQLHVMSNLCPGTRHSYSNLGYLALGEVIEAVTGQSYESYVTSLLSGINPSLMYVGLEHRVHWQSEEVGNNFHWNNCWTVPFVCAFTGCSTFPVG